MTRPTVHNAKQVIAAIKGSGGIKKTIADRLDVSRWTVDNYLERWITVKQAYDEECEQVLDLAEAKLIKKINSEEWPAIKFILKTKGKDRGYVERQEHTGKGGGEIILSWGDNE